MSASMVDKKKNSILKLLNGTTIAVCLTLILILLFALLIRFTGINDRVIFPVNQVIKIVSIFIGALIAMKGVKEKGLLKGIIIGFAYYVISYLTFSILQGSFAVNLSNLYDLVLTTIMGGLIGLIVVHMGK